MKATHRRSATRGFWARAPWVETQGYLMPSLRDFPTFNPQWDIS